MRASPVAIGLKRRFGAPRSLVDRQGYHAFTAFDEVIDPARLSDLLSKLSPRQRRNFENAQDRFGKLFTLSGSRSRRAARASFATFCTPFRPRSAPEPRSRS